jgi:cytochrome b
MNSAEKWVKVWDPLVRVGHWVTVLAFFTAYFTEDEFLTLHVWAGYVAAAVVCVRLVWGFVGTRHARFTDFVRPPKAALGYIRDLLSKQPKRYIGHNPAGGVMIIMLLIGILGTVYSGLVLYAVEENEGPFSGWAGLHTALSVLPAAYADEDEEDEEEEDEGHGHDAGQGSEDGDLEEFWEETHEIFANLTLLLIAMHIAGVLVSSYAHRENLIRSMFTGNKRLKT